MDRATQPISHPNSAKWSFDEMVWGKMQATRTSRIAKAASTIIESRTPADFWRNRTGTLPKKVAGFAAAGSQVLASIISGVISKVYLGRLRRREVSLRKEPALGIFGADRGSHAAECVERPAD